MVNILGYFQPVNRQSNFGEDYEKILPGLINMRIEYKLGKLQGNQLDKDIKEEILKKKHQLRDQAEKEILSRLNALRKHLRIPARDPHISLEEIFRQREKRNIKTLLVPLMGYLRKQKGNATKSERG